MMVGECARSCVVASGVNDVEDVDVDMLKCLETIEPQIRPRTNTVSSADD